MPSSRSDSINLALICLKSGQLMPRPHRRICHGRNAGAAARAAPSPAARNAAPAPPAAKPPAAEPIIPLVHAPDDPGPEGEALVEAEAEPETEENESWRPFD